MQSMSWVHLRAMCFVQVLHPIVDIDTVMDRWLPFSIDCVNVSCSNYAYSCNWIYSILVAHTFPEKYDSRATMMRLKITASGMNVREKLRTSRSEGEIKCSFRSVFCICARYGKCAWGVRGETHISSLLKSLAREHGNSITIWIFSIKIY